MKHEAHVIVVASMICCMVGNTCAYWAMLPRYPGYSCPSASPGKCWLHVESGTTPVTNHLKGFMPYAGTDHVFPHSLEFNCFSLRSVAVACTGVFNLSTIDDFLDDVASSGHQAVFRVYLENPSLSTGVPQFLINAGVEMRPYTDEGGGLSPDYDDPRVVDEMHALMHALATAFDGDPRVGFIRAGLLGKWGEWHVYPHTEWMANETTQRAVLQAYTDVINETRILVRYASTVTRDYPVGFHDNSCAFSTIYNVYDWYF